MYKKINFIIKYKLYNLSYYLQKKKYKKNFNEKIKELNLLYPSRNSFYKMMHYMYNFHLTESIKAHRIYFSNNSRGFGEDALHAMWYKIFNEYKPVNVLEIGVYRGQVISLWGLIADCMGYEININGISPFSSAGDEVSDYLMNLNYLDDTNYNFQKFTNQKVTLIQNFSNDINAINFIKNKKWDLIYIDGSHDFEIALSDYKLCKSALIKNGILVIDDSSLYTDYKPAFFSFAGHPGPSLIVKEFADKELKRIMSVGHNNVYINS